MPVLRRNILANYAGQAWVALMSFLFIPVYIRLLGIEGFGLVGFMLGLQALAMMLDLGMGGALNRELARRLPAGEAAGSLVRTLEVLVWGVAVVLAVALWSLRWEVASHWLHPGSLGLVRTAAAVGIIGIVVALQLPVGFYANGLSGLERQQSLNVVAALFATFRGAGVLPLLYAVPTVEAFLYWHAGLGLLHALVLGRLLWRSLPAGPARVVPAELQAVGRFAGGLVAIMAVSLTVTQVDRLVLSARAPLADLGYFSLAISVSAGLARMVQPLFNAFYPRYSRLVASGELAQLRSLYHLGSQIMVVIVAPLALVLAVFGRDVLLLWTGDAGSADYAALPLALLVGGTGLNALMNLPYALQLAHGWTRLTLASNVVALVAGVPYCLWAVEVHGLAGAASLWLLVNAGFVLVSLPLMHRRLLPGELARWYGRDVLPPLLAAAAVVLPASLLLPPLPRTLPALLLLLAIGTASLLAAVAAAPGVRAELRRLLAARRRQRPPA